MVHFDDCDMCMCVYVCMHMYVCSDSFPIFKALSLSEVCCLVVHGMLDNGFYRRCPWQTYLFILFVCSVCLLCLFALLCLFSFLKKYRSWIYAPSVMILIVYCERRHWPILLFHTLTWWCDMIWYSIYMTNMMWSDMTKYKTIWCDMTCCDI